MWASETIKQRLRSLEQHLKEENPILVAAVDSFRKLDRVGYATGLLKPRQSFATQISWWPLVSVLGTFSAGKSTFINHYLGRRLQETGNQAVDDKFTVICFGREPEARVLPGLALDADPRFPFYSIADELEKVAPGEGVRVDAYLQLKTCPSDRLRGKILIDSPGFDADAQRSATLRLTNHIIDLSDLVLVMFDARHPEPGAMVDTLTHLVRDTIGRADSSKFMYILNQLDTTAREDNPEDVFGSWHRALAKEGLTAGRFYGIYSPDAAVVIADETLRKRFESKRDAELAEIHARIEGIGIERAYRIIGALDQTAREIESHYVPRLQALIDKWRVRVLRLDGLLFGLLAALAVGLSIRAGYWQGWRFAPPWLSSALDNPQYAVPALTLVVAVLISMHFYLRRFVARRMSREIERGDGTPVERGRLLNAFAKNTRFWRSLFEVRPVGWGRFNQRRIKQVLSDSDRYVQSLNDRFTDPSGRHTAPAAAATAPAVEEPQPAEGLRRAAEG